MRIYLAGKIAPNDWRNTLLAKPDRRAGGLMGQFEPEWPIWEDVLIGGHDYCGPFFVACDHACGHGASSHGVGLQGNGVAVCIDSMNSEASMPTRARVVRAAISAIRSCHTLFAWIDSLDAYGTIAEIGVARAFNRRIVVAFPNTLTIDDLWFPIEMSGRRPIVADSAKAAYAMWLRESRTAKTTPSLRAVK
jgi:hypothetical protein